MDGLLGFLGIGMMGTLEGKPESPRLDRSRSAPTSSGSNPALAGSSGQTEAGAGGGEHRSSTPTRKDAEEVVDSACVYKGMVVCLSTSYAAIVRMAGVGHPHHRYLGVDGIVTAIGLDRKACIVVFAGKEEKMFIGRDGEFHLAHDPHGAVASPSARAAEGDTPEARGRSRGPGALSPRTPTRDAGDGREGAARGLKEILVNGDNVRKGVYVALSRARAEEVAAQGPSHPQHACLGATAVIRAVGQDRKACIAMFGDVEHKFWCGRGDEHHLAHAPAPGALTERGAVYCPILGVLWAASTMGGAVAKRVDRPESTLRAGDVLFSVDGARVGGAEEAVALVGAAKGLEAVLKIRRFQGILGEVVDGNVAVQVKAPAAGAAGGGGGGGGGGGHAVAEVPGAGAPGAERRVDWRVVSKGLSVRLMRAYADEVRAGVASHVHAGCEGGVGAVTAVGLDSQACIARFGTRECKFLIGRGGQYQLAVAKEAKESKESKGDVAPSPSRGAQNASASAAGKEAEGRSRAGGGGKAVAALDPPRSAPTSAVSQAKAFLEKFSPTNKAQGGPAEAPLLLALDDDAPPPGARVAEGVRREHGEAAGGGPAGRRSPAAPDGHAERRLASPPPQAGGGVMSTTPERSQAHAGLPPPPEQGSPAKPSGGAARGRLPHDAEPSAHVPAAQRHSTPTKGAAASSPAPGPDTPARASGAPQAGLGLVVEEDSGDVYVIGFVPEGPAAAAAPLLKVGDIVVSMQGERIRTAADARRLAPGDEGTTVLLECVRTMSRTDAAPKRRITTLLSLRRGKPGMHQVDLQMHEEVADMAPTPRGASSLPRSPHMSPPHSKLANGAAIHDLLQGTPLASPETAGSEGAMETPRVSLPSHMGSEMPNFLIRLSHKEGRFEDGMEETQGWWEVSPSGFKPHHPPEGSNSAVPALQGSPGSRCGEAGHRDSLTQPLAPRRRASSVAQGADDLVFDVPFEDIRLMVPAMGVGTCKTAYMATWADAVVAALEIRNGDVRQEVAVLRRLGRHPNLPIFHGVCMGPDCQVYLIEEFFALGGLDVQLEIWEGQLSTAVQFGLVQQICEGMVAIHGHGVLHRDLSARNVLVQALNAESMADCWVKVSDFGSACIGKTAAGFDPMPWRWAPPEAHRENRWSQKSDVWAFGITMWEVFTYAMIPYVEIESDEDLCQRVFSEGLRLECPAGCPYWIYKIMCKCWEDPEEGRPSFGELSAELGISAHLCSSKLSPETHNGRERASGSERPELVY